MRKHTWAYLVAILLVGLFFAQAVGNLSAQSPVVDEPSHIARAMAYWRVGDLRLQIGHPPLIHALAGLPLLLEPGVPQLTSLPGWQPLEREKLNGHALWDEGRPTDRIVFLARWPVLMLALLLGALIFRWAGERFGIRAAIVALFLFAFDPNLLAHSVLITTDLGVTFFILLAVYSFDRWARRPSRTWLVICGVTFGLAMAAKFTAVILIPALVLLALVLGWRTRRMVRTLAALAAMFVIGAIVVWAVYRFEVGPFPPLPVNVPASRFLDGLLRVKERDDEGRMAFLLGKTSPRGWWYYFPIAFAVKTPLPTLLLLGVAVFPPIAW
jgi:dolichyl-phosphate-mannose--protein O-mannosyl transferase